MLGVALVTIVIIPYSKQRLEDMKTQFLTVAVIFFDLFVFVNYKDR